MTEDYRLSEHELRMRMQFEAEEETLHQLLKMEKEYRAHNTLMRKELVQQKELIDRLWLLSQRYIILVSTGPCCKYPDIYSGPAEDVILTEFHDKLKQLHGSNCRIMNSLHTLRLSGRVFEHLCSRLDMTAESPFLIGDTFHKPLSYFIELVSDLFKCFYATILKLKCYAHQLDPIDLSGLEEYKELTKPSEEFEEYLMVGLTYCKCLKPPKVCGAKTPLLDLRTCKDSELKVSTKGNS